MPLLQPHEPRIRHRPGESVWCANQAEEEALGNGWSRYPQLATPGEVPIIVAEDTLDIAAVAAAVSPERGIVLPPASALKRRGGWPKGRSRKKKA